MDTPLPILDPTPQGPEELHTGGIAGHPKGLSNLFFAELWERFSYYGMRALLTLFMVAPMAAGGLGFDQVKAASVYGNYVMSSYMLCILGGFIADNFIGARRAVLIGGFIITLGHFTLTLNSLPTFYAGLILVAVGTGLLKPSISTLVGGLYARGDARRDAGFSLFYMGINIGAFAAPLVTGYLAQDEGFKQILVGWGLDPLHSWHWGFGAAGVGMTLGMLVYVRRLNWIRHIGEAPDAQEPRPWLPLVLVATGTFVLLYLMMQSDRKDSFLVPFINRSFSFIWQPIPYVWLAYTIYSLPILVVLYFGVLRKDEDSKRIAAIGVFFIAAVLFWAVFEQAGTSLTLFADELTRNEAFGRPYPSAWFQSVNSFFVIALAPVFAWLWVTLSTRQPSVALKFVFGLIFLGLSFALMVPAAQATVAGKVSPWWLIGVYFLQTLGEMCLSPVGLSTMSKLAPARLTGLIMGVWFLATSLGNKLSGTLSEDFSSKDPVALSHFFSNQAIVVGIVAVVLLALVPWVRHLMGTEDH
ncbi:MAG: peptide MFS transporter [Verrucomicrobia bacterium]|nr:peptide MFS transporter [Verrucomicrobiota bacterium]